MRECWNTRDRIACSVQCVLEFCGRGRSRCCTCDRDACRSETGRRRYVTKRDLVKNGYTDECQACTQLASGMHNARVLHDDRCRDRIGELTAEDDDQRQVERVSGTVRSEFEIPRPEAGKEMDVGEPTIVEDQQPVQQPVPTGRRRARQKCSRRSKSHSDHFAWSKISTMSRSWSLCILSNKLNACETTAILNPSKFASCAKRLGLRSGFDNCKSRRTNVATPLESRSHESHSTEEKKKPIRFRRTNAHRARNGTLQCSAGPERHGYHGTQHVT